MWFAGWLITVVFVWEDPWVCLWEQNPDFNYIPSGYSDYVLPEDLVSLAFTYPVMCTGFNRKKRKKERTKCLDCVYTKDENFRAGRDLTVSSPAPSLFVGIEV